MPIDQLPDREARAAALATIGRSLLVEAGAGSGKTALMAGRVAVLFANGVEPKHVDEEPLGRPPEPTAGGAADRDSAAAG